LEESQRGKGTGIEPLHPMAQNQELKLHNATVAAHRTFHAATLSRNITFRLVSSILLTIQSKHRPFGLHVPSSLSKSLALCTAGAPHRVKSSREEGRYMKTRDLWFSIHCRLRFATSCVAFANRPVRTDGHFLHGDGPVNEAMGGADTGLCLDATGSIAWNPACAVKFSGRRFEFHEQSLCPGVPSEVRSMRMRLGRDTCRHAQRNHDQPSRHVVDAGILVYLSPSGQRQCISRGHAGSQRVRRGL